MRYVYFFCNKNKKGAIFEVLFNGDTLLKITKDLKNVFIYVGSSYQ